MAGFQRSYSLSSGFGYTNKQYTPSYSNVVVTDDDMYDIDIDIPMLSSEEEDYDHQFFCTEFIDDGICDDCLSGKTFYDRDTYDAWKVRTPSFFERLMGG